MDTPYSHTHLKGIFNTILSHSFIVLLRGSYFICHITQNEEGLLSSYADQFTRVWPEDLGKLWTRGKNGKGQNEIEKIRKFVKLLENRLKQKVSQSYVFRLDLDATDQLCVLPVIKRQAIHWPHPKQETSIDSCREEEHIKWAIQWELFTSKSEVFYRTMFTLPSAPKSGLKDFFSLKFLKILTILLLSLMAYLL